MTKKMKYLLVFLVTVIFQLIALWQIRSNFIDVAATGSIYRAPAEIVRYGGSEKDYVTLRIKLEPARWLSPDKPKNNEQIYVAIAADKKGKIIVKGASLNKPSQGDYITTTGFVHEGVADYSVPFSRFYMERRHLESLPLAEYAKQNSAKAEKVDEDGMPYTDVEYTPKHDIVAEFRLADGRGVITNVFVDGHSLLDLYNTEAGEPVHITPTGKEE